MATVSSVGDMLTAPYVSVAEFKSAPTWLDVDDLVPGGVAAAQDAALFNTLLEASAWADNWCGASNGRKWLGAHTCYEQSRTSVDRYGRVFLNPSDVPVRQVTGVAYGADFQNMTAITDLSQAWVEDARGIVVSMIPHRGSWAGSLEFGLAVPQSGEIFVEYTYVAGYASTALSAPVSAGGSSLVVGDPTGLQPPSTGLLGTFNGSTARLWDPGLEEAFQITSGYTAGATTVPLTAALANAHAAGVLVSEVPADAHSAVINMTVSLLLREDVAGDEPFSETPYGPSARKSEAGGKAGGLLDHAYELLEPYRRVK